MLIRNIKSTEKWIKLEIQMLRVDSSFINRINKLLDTQTLEFISTFFNCIGSTFKNCALFKTHMILLGFFIC